MLHIGCHLSVSQGFEAMGKNALGIGADTFAFFTRNPRGGAAKEMNPADVQALLALCAEHSFAPLVAHAPYTMNVCSADEGIQDFAVRTLCDDLMRMEALPGNYYNFHPGSHTGQGAETGIALIASALTRALPLAEHTTVLLETMAGKGSEIGRNFEELRAVIDAVGDWNSRLGVCLDTCHVHDGGFDIAGNLDAVLDEFDRVIGLARLRAVHLNDSLNVRGSRKDRHAKIGEGEIGLEALCAVINHPALRGLPFILETPNELSGYKSEIALLRSRYRE